MLQACVGDSSSLQSHLGKRDLLCSVARSFCPAPEGLKGVQNLRGDRSSSACLMRRLREVECSCMQIQFPGLSITRLSLPLSLARSARNESLWPSPGPARTAIVPSDTAMDDLPCQAALRSALLTLLTSHEGWDSVLGCPVTLTPAHAVLGCAFCRLPCLRCLPRLRPDTTLRRLGR